MVIRPSFKLLLSAFMLTYVSIKAVGCSHCEIITILDMLFITRSYPSIFDWDTPYIRTLQELKIQINEQSTQNRMAMSKLVKEDIDFVEPPSEELNCPICLGLLRDPFLTACCGNHFCETCANKVKQNNNRCPLCQDTPLNGIINKGLKRKVNELKVYCRHKQTGCGQVGD